MKKIPLVTVLILTARMCFAQAVPHVPELIVPGHSDQWKKQRKDIRETLVQVMGAVPPRPSPKSFRVLSKDDKGAYTLEKFEFTNGAGAVVPGILLLPKNGRTRHPGIYYCHWHGGNYDLGKREIFTTHHTPQVPADALTTAGYAVIAIDAYCFGERSGKGPGGPTETGSAEELTSSKQELWLGRSLWAMMVNDDLAALDYFFTRPEIDTARVAVTGISMGATRTWWLMALDERLKAAVAVGCMTRYQELISEQKLRYHGIYYYVPGILKSFDSEAIISLSAPRPILFLTGDSDNGSPVSGIKKIEEVTRRVYKLYEAEKNFESIIYPNTGHVYTPDMWDRMMSWIARSLK